MFDHGNTVIVVTHGRVLTDLSKDVSAKRLCTCTARIRRVFLLGRKTSELSPADIELIKEAAGALARCGERLEQALEKLRAAEKVLDVYSGNRGRFTTLSRNGPEAGFSRQEAVEQYRKAWREADKARYVYIVQREAIGFRTHKFADRVYPLPTLRSLSHRNSLD